MVKIRAAYDANKELLNGAEMNQMIREGYKAFITIAGGCLNPKNAEGRSIPVANEQLKDILRNNTQEVYINFIEDKEYSQDLNDSLAELLSE